MDFRSRFAWDLVRKNQRHDAVRMDIMSFQNPEIRAEEEYVIARLGEMGFQAEKIARSSQSLLYVSYHHQRPTVAECRPRC